MQTVHKKDSKFLLEVLSYFESSLDEIISPPYFLMSNSTEQPILFAGTIAKLRQRLLDYRICWVLQNMFRKQRTVEEMISQMSGDNPINTTDVPSGFMEIFKLLPRVPMEHMLKMLSYDDICRLRIVSGPFAEYLDGSGRHNFAINQLLQGSVKLRGTELVQIIRYNRIVDINHDQFTKSLRTVRIKSLMIAQEGTLRAASFHIPELKCEKLDVRVSNPLSEEEENELAQVFEQIVVNSHITRLTLIARTNGNCAELRNRLVAITDRSETLIQADTVISVIPP